MIVENHFNDKTAEMLDDNLLEADMLSVEEYVCAIDAEAGEGEEGFQGRQRCDAWGE